MTIDPGTATVVAALIAAIASIIVKALDRRASPSGATPAVNTFWRVTPWLIILGIVAIIPLGYFWGQRAQSTVIVGGLPRSANTIEYFDFTTVDGDWARFSRCDSTFSTCEQFNNSARAPVAPIDRGVAYELQLNADQWSFYTVQYERPIQADVITAQFYTPKRPDIAENWFGLAVLDKDQQWVGGSYQNNQRGEWTTITLDLRRLYDRQDNSLSQQPLYFQVVYAVKGGQTLEQPTVTVGLDEVSWYKSSGEIRGRESQGPNRHLWTFEDDLPHNWKLSDTRVQTDTLSTTYAYAYRGRQSLVVNTKLNKGEFTALRTTLPDAQLQKAVWVAEVFLPANAPAGITVWANLFTFAETGWSDSEPKNIPPGQWTTLVWDLRDVTWKKEEKPVIGIQIGVVDGDYIGPIYIDDVQVFKH